MSRQKNPRKAQRLSAADALLREMQSQTIDKLMRFARAVEPFVADAACNDKFGWKKSREIYQECERIRPLIWAAQAGEADAESDIQAGEPPAENHKL